MVARRNWLYTDQSSVSTNLEDRIFNCLLFIEEPNDKTII